MKCEDCLDVIEEYFDRELDAESSNEVAGHLKTCAMCKEVFESLKQEQVIYAAYKREVEVTSALWQGIEARIKQEAVQPVVVKESVVESVGVLARLRNFFVETLRAPRMSFALAAALVIVAVGITVVVMNYLNSRSGNQPAYTAGGNPQVAPTPAPQNQPGNNGQVAQSPSPTTDNPGEDNLALPKKESTEMAGRPKLVKAPIEKVNPAMNAQPLVSSSKTAEKLLRDAEQKYLAAITILQRDYNKRRPQLDSEFVAKMDAALKTIDNTIAETRKAVQKNPDDPIALQYMLTAYAKKVEVLRGVTGS
ncbi:MAG: zf-HC2 domain-containing protein [Acidobacteriota bacterium]